MKKIFLTAVTTLFTFVLFAAEPVSINEKVLQAFQKSFKHAQDVSWHEYNTHYEVKFTHNAVDSRITYDTEGNILKTIRYYGEDQLPLFLRAKLQKQYKDKKVFGVTELAEEGQLDYYVILEDEKNWIHVKCDAVGSMSVYKKYKKA